MKHHGRAIEQGNIGDGRTEEIAYLVPDQLNQAILVELCGQRLGDAIDGAQLSSAFTNRVLLFIDDLVGIGIVERDGRVGCKVFEQADILLGIGVLLETLDGDDTEHTLLRDERQINHRRRRVRGAAVFERNAAGVLIRRNIAREFFLDVVEQNGLTMVDTPDGKLIFVVGATGVGSVALAVFDRQAVLDQALLRPIEADAEDACVQDLVHAFVELEEDGVEVERGSNFFADVAEQLDRVFLRRDFRGLGANFFGALVDGGFKSPGLRFECFRFAP